MFAAAAVDNLPPLHAFQITHWNLTRAISLISKPNPSPDIYERVTFWDIPFRKASHPTQVCLRLCLRDGSPTELFKILEL